MSIDSWLKWIAGVSRYRFCHLPQMYEYFDWGNRQPAVEMSQVANDEYAEICAKHPERFRMFASIPMMDADQACKELERARRCPGFSGITLCTHIREARSMNPSSRPSLTMPMQIV